MGLALASELGNEDLIQCMDRHNCRGPTFIGSNYVNVDFHQLPTPYRYSLLADEQVPVNIMDYYRCPDCDFVGQVEKKGPW